jgi:hypothetical protein
MLEERSLKLKAKQEDGSAVNVKAVKVKNEEECKKYYGKVISLVGLEYDFIKCLRSSACVCG